MEMELDTQEVISININKKMLIETKTDQVVYITINGWVYYINDSTGEQRKWKRRTKE